MEVVLEDESPFLLLVVHRESLLSEQTCHDLKIMVPVVSIFLFAEGSASLDVPSQVVHELLLLANFDLTAHLEEKLLKNFIHARNPYEIV